MELIATKSGAKSRTYRFGQKPSQDAMEFLHKSPAIESYQLSGHELTVTTKEPADWQQLETDFIQPGLQKAVGQPVTIKS